ncbi:MAG: cardiolipin synthase [Pirellulaceae bacterium]|nr:cardiolipin synthase [Pirellulaceae bacterium]
MIRRIFTAWMTEETLVEGDYQVILVSVITLVVIFEILGLISAYNALMSTRTSQGTIAWMLALITWPVFAVPLYWIFGRSKFQGNVNARRIRDVRVTEIEKDLSEQVANYRVNLGSVIGEARALERLADLPFLSGNDVELLINGRETFDAIFAAIDEAEEYVVCEFFIVHDDELGRQLKDRLIRKAKQGCNTYLLFDEVGSQGMTKTYLRDLAEGGVHVSRMNTSQGRHNRFQVNFRNHRKIVVVDGRVAFVGGHNVGDEYVGKHDRLTPWRDTHLKIEGPSVLGIQLAFVGDWHWATKSFPKLSWKTHVSKSADKTVFVLPSGPADDDETCGLFFMHAINSAQRRIWIASPYFVPDEGIIDALKLAAMRGVDVRILIPGLADKWFIKMAALSYVDEVVAAGVRMYEFAPGFLHQKVLLIDDSVSTIGTANFDNRSFRLNFEISVLVIDRGFAKLVEAMLEHDLSTSTLLENVDRLSPAEVVGSRVARLCSPVL